MRDQPLRKIGARLFRTRREDPPKGTQRQSMPAHYGLDRTLVDAFVGGTLDPRGEQALAQQVALIAPFHWTLPTAIVEDMTRIIDHLGGQHELLAWLDRHPGRPRLLARLSVLIGLLDRFSAEPAVVTALGEFRADTPFPAGLKGYLVPATDAETLASLAFEIESLLGENRGDDALALAMATLDMLKDVAPRAAEIDPEVGEMSELLEHSRQDLVEVSTGA
jgi:hypothetical protein